MLTTAGEHVYPRTRKTDDVQSHFGQPVHDIQADRVARCYTLGAPKPSKLS